MLVCSSSFKELWNDLFGYPELSKCRASSRLRARYFMLCFTLSRHLMKSVMPLMLRNLRWSDSVLECFLLFLSLSASLLSSPAVGFSFQKRQIALSYKKKWAFFIVIFLLVWEYQEETQNLEGNLFFNKKHIFSPPHCISNCYWISPLKSGLKSRHVHRQGIFLQRQHHFP